MENLTKSLWSRTTDISPREPLSGDITVKAAVIGAGMAGILTAYLLKKQGIQAVVLEADRIAGGQTKNTTAKITSQHGVIYQKLLKELGEHGARLYARANESAINAYGEIIEKENISCHFERLPACLYSTEKERIPQLKREAKAAAFLGISACFTELNDLPFETAGAVCFENQAQFHPLEFVKALSDNLTVYEKTRVLRVKKHEIYTDRGTVTAEHIVFASHYPFINFPGFYFTRLHQERSYVLGLSGSEKLHGMYYSADDDGLSLRWDKNTLLLGGGSHRTGKSRPDTGYEPLLKAAGKYYPDCKIIARWSAQDCMSHDEIPFIGQYSAFRPYWHVATGFKKWGMTSSMISAMIIKDRICGFENPYESLFHSQRFLFRASIKNLLTDLGESTKGLIMGTFHLPLTERMLPAGQAGILRIGLRRYACFKDKTGTLHKISARCPHLGCELQWNPSEQTWDCPCHGSRFDYDGKLLDNPAQAAAKGK